MPFYWAGLKVRAPPPSWHARQPAGGRALAPAATRLRPAAQLPTPHAPAPATSPAPAARPLQAYDLLAGSQGLQGSKYLAAEAARRELPTLAPKQPDGELLKGAVSRRCCC